MKKLTLLAVVFFLCAAPSFSFGEEPPEWGVDTIGADTLPIDVTPSPEVTAIVGPSWQLDPAPFIDADSSSAFTFDNYEIMTVIFPDGYPKTTPTPENVFVTFHDMFGKYSIRDIKSALKQRRGKHD